MSFTSRVRKRQRRHFLRAPKRRISIPNLGAAGAVALMGLAGLNQLTGGKVVWSPAHSAVVWASPNSSQVTPDWVRLFPIPLVTTIFKVAGDTSFANPGDWNDANNSVAAIGHGGKGNTSGFTTLGGPGGGGGAYAARTNIPLSANGDFPVTVAIGAAGSVGSTTTAFNVANAGRQVIADAGRDATTSIAGAAGAVANCTPNTALSGGNGAVAGGAGGPRSATGNVPAAGGGGAGGPNGAGSVGGTASATTSGAGGNADGGTVAGPAGTTINGPGAVGNSGTEFDASHGCGTGGAGGGITVGDLGGIGGNYGGGAGGNSGNTGAAQNGAAGLIIISYTAAAAGLPAGTVYDLSIPAPLRRSIALLQPQSQRAEYIIGQEKLPQFKPTWDVPPPRRYPVENRGYTRDLDIQLIGKDQLPAFAPDLSLPMLPARRSRVLIDAIQNLLQSTLIPLPAYLNGFETGDASELNSLGASSVIVTSPVRSGNYALKQTTTLTRLMAAGSLGAAQSVVRLGVQMPSVTAALTTFLTEEATGGTARLLVRLTTAGKISVQDNGVTLGLSTTTGSTVLLVNTWYRIETVLDLTAGGVVQVWLNGNLEINVTHTNDVSATTTGCYRLTGAANPNQYFFDDIRVDTATLIPPGDGKIIARQGMPGTPTYDAWTKSGAATAWQAWSDTPFNTATNANSSTSSAAQTMLVAQFSTPQAGRGPELIGPGDIVNAIKVGAVFKRATGGSPSLRLRYSGSNVDTVVTGATTDAWRESILPAIPAPTLDVLEAGMVKAADGNLTTVEDVWMMVEAQTFTGAVPFYPVDWRIPPVARRVASYLDTQSPSFPGLWLIGVQPIPVQAYDLRIPPARLFARSLLEWWTEPPGPPIVPPTPIVTVPAIPSGGIGMRRFDKKGRLRYPEAQQSPFEGYTTEQLKRMVQQELPRLDKAEWQEAKEAVEAGTISAKAFDALPVGFDLMRARAIEIGAGLMLAELRAAKARRSAEDEEDDAIALLLLLS